MKRSAEESSGSDYSGSDDEKVEATIADGGFFFQFPAEKDRVNL